MMVELRTAPEDSQAAGAVDAERWLRVRHETVYDYDAPVVLAHHMAHLSPRVNDQQRVRDWSLTIAPAPDEWAVQVADPGSEPALPYCQLSFDCWGNGRLAFSHSQVHSRLLVVSSFEAGLTLGRSPDPDLGPAWEEVARSLRYHTGAAHSEAVEFTLPSRFVPCTLPLAAFGSLAFTPGRSVAGGALALMALVHQRFEYRPLSTSVHTRASEALAQSRGVCQDFAHVMIGACRSLGLAARYVSGYLLTHPAPGRQRLVGTDASHAWVAVWCPEQGWLALDPTNNVPAGLDHVTLAWGRDYNDVAPLHGVIRGGGRAQPQVAVAVEPLCATAQADSALAAAAGQPPAETARKAAAISKDSGVGDA
jgi:hypothetical protein